MKEFLIAVMTVSLTASAVTMLAPEGKGIGKQIRFVCALAVCVALSAPMLRLLGTELPEALPALPDVDAPAVKEAKEAIVAAGTMGLCRELEAQVAARFGIKEPHLTLTTDSSDPSAVLLLGGVLDGEGDLKEACQYVSDLLGCEITCEEE